MLRAIVLIGCALMLSGCAPTPGNAIAIGLTFALLILISLFMGFLNVTEPPKPLTTDRALEWVDKCYKDIKEVDRELDRIDAKFNGEEPPPKDFYEAMQRQIDMHNRVMLVNDPRQVQFVTSASTGPR